VPGIVACRALVGFGVVRALLELLRDRARPTRSARI
jgi:hypothetical protein